MGGGGVRGRDDEMQQARERRCGSEEALCRRTSRLQFKGSMILLTRLRRLIFQHCATKQHMY